MTVQFTCTGPGQIPTWRVNERVAVSKGNCYTLTIREAAGTNFISAILAISGNHTCDTFNIYCTIQVSESQLLYSRNIQFSLTFQGLLQTWFTIPAVIDTNPAAILCQCFINHYNKLMLQFCSSQVIFLHLKIFTSMSQLTPQTLHQS